MSVSVTAGSHATPAAVLGTSSWHEWTAVGGRSVPPVHHHQVVGGLHHVGLSVHLVLPFRELGLHLIDKIIASLRLPRDLGPIPGLGPSLPIWQQTFLLLRRNTCKVGLSSNDL